MPYKDPEARRKWQKDWRTSNPEKRRAQSARYNDRHSSEKSVKAKLRRAVLNEEINRVARARYAASDEEREKKYATHVLNIVRIKREVIAHYGGKCSCCGEEHLEFLSVDHVDGDGGRHRQEMKGGSLYGWLIKNDFPSEYRLRVLCHNCNFVVSHYGYCPHSDMEGAFSVLAEKKRDHFKVAFDWDRKGTLGPRLKPGRPRDATTRAGAT